MDDGRLGETVVFVFLTVTERSNAGTTVFPNMAAPTGADV